MNPYSQDLRGRVVAALKTGKKSQADVAETFGVSLSTVEKWWRQWRETGQSSARPRQHGPRRTLAECDDVIRTAVQKQPDVTLDELCARVAASESGMSEIRRVTPGAVRLPSSRRSGWRGLSSSSR